MKVFLFIFFILNLLLLFNCLKKSNSYLGNKNVENCVACKFIWKNIEEALSSNESEFMNNNKRSPILAAQSFQYFCRIAPDLFFEPCNFMFEKLFFMTQDFCAYKTIEDICSANELCPKEININESINIKNC